MKRTIFSAILTALMLISCSINSQETTVNDTVYDAEQNLPGDSTLYGLACEGSTDSILICLPYSGGNPDTLNIIEARDNRKVFGHPSIGDRLAIILNTTDKSVADMVITLDNLQGEWCYQVLPTLHHRSVHPAHEQQSPTLSDSLYKKWMQPREYGLEIKRDHVVHTIGNPRPGTAGLRGAVEYPTAKRYHEWHIFNGHLVLHETHADTLGNRQIISSDTADLVLMRRDTLVLRFADHEQGYYRRK